MTLLDRDPEELRAAIAQAQADGDLKGLTAIVEGLEASLRWTPQEYQMPPPPGWRWWVFAGGAGSGKTDTGAAWLDEHMKGPPCDKRLPGGHLALMAGPTFGDAITTMWKEPAGLHAHNDQLEMVGRKDGTVVIWPDNGIGRAEARVVGLHTEQDANLLRARAANCCTWWVDEAAICTHLKLAVDMIDLRARSGPRPHGIATSTPKPTPGWKYLITLEGATVTRASALLNAYLSDVHKARLARFRGTRLEAQEVHGEELDDFEGALVTREEIDDGRIRDFPEDALERIQVLGIHRTVEGVDPSTWDPELGDDPGSVAEGIETGLVVCGIGSAPPGWEAPEGVPRNAPHIYVLEDASMRGAGEVWGRKAIEEYHRWQCSDIVPEVNLGGMVLSIVRLIDPGVHIYRRPGEKKRVGVHAAIGKRARAEPTALLYQQRRAHHVGTFPGLESQWRQWDPRESWSPDRLDAHVWAVEALAPSVRVGGGVATSSAALQSRRIDPLAR